MTDIRRHQEIMLDVLDEKEWIQGDLFEGPHGLRGDQFAFPMEEVTGVCLAGSYSYAVIRGMVYAADWYEVSEAILAAARDLLPEERCVTVPFFNDCKDTTEEDIRLIVKTAIEKASEAA